MNILNFVGKTSHTNTCWIYTEKGYDYMLRKQTSAENLASRKPGMPVLEHYRQYCPTWWVYNGWVTEAEGQLTIF